MTTSPLSWSHKDFEYVHHELKRRIQAETAHFQGELPEHNAIAWDGYIAALLEWGVITPTVHSELSELLPAVDGMGTFLGRDS